MERGRRLAFDYGDIRIGVAVSDPDCILATPIGALQSKNPELVREIIALVDQYLPVKIFIGLPKNMSGDDGKASEKARLFGQRIAAELSIPIVYIDERLSTVSAQRRLQEAGKDAKEMKSLIDSMAAVAILDQGMALEKS